MWFHGTESGFGARFPVWSVVRAGSGRSRGWGSRWNGLVPRLPVDGMMATGGCRRAESGFGIRLPIWSLWVVAKNPIWGLDRKRQTPYRTDSDG